MKSLIISEQHNIASVVQEGKAQDFFISRNEFGVGDIYTVLVENIMPSINAVFVKLEEGRMGFLHANDIPGEGSLHDRLAPGQKLMVQIEKEPTGKKGPRVNPKISIPGRYFVLTTESVGISISKKIADYEEKDRLKSIANLMKPEEFGLVIRTEASARSKEELEEDFVNLWNIWKNIVDKHDQKNSPGVVYKEKDFLYSVLRDNFNSTVDEIVVSSLQAKYRTEDFLKTWTGREVSVRFLETDQILQKTDVEKELRSCLSKRVDLPSGGYIIIQTMEALTAIDINSGKFTASNTLRETVRRTNMEAAIEIARHIRLRNIGGMIIIDFIDMAEREDRIRVMETLESALRPDKAKPQVGPLSELCLVEITRKRSGQALSEVFGEECPVCNGTGLIFKLAGSGKSSSSGGQQSQNKYSKGGSNQGNKGNFQKQNRQNSNNKNQNPKSQGNKPNNKRDNYNKKSDSDSNKPQNQENSSPRSSNNDSNKSFNKNKESNSSSEQSSSKPDSVKAEFNAMVESGPTNKVSKSPSKESSSDDLEKVFSKIEPKDTGAQSQVNNLEAPADSFNTGKKLDYEGEELIKDLTSKKTFSHFHINDEIS
ncbi:MAG: Rne/Rng family ribonuclease [Candidatus Caenarcaniphilales bacterium]|nr:Rne/Rng family ribonuclease [Candidatus Caenarcaniphilales bacterium]